MIYDIYIYITYIYIYVWSFFLILRLFKNRKTISKRFPSVVSPESISRCICKECRDRPENSLDAMSAAMGVSCGPCGPANAAKLAAAVPLFGLTFLPGWGGCLWGRFCEILGYWILRYWCREIDLMLTFGVEWRDMEKFWRCWWTIRVAKKANDNPEHYRHNFTWSINKQLGVKLQLDGFLCLRIFQCFATALEFCQGGPGVVESRRLVGRLVGWWELVGRSLGELVTSGGMVWERTFWLIYKMFGENIESEFCLGFIWIKEKPVLLTVSYIWITLECSCLGELHLSHSTCFNFVVEIDHPIKFADLDVQTPRVLLFFCFAFPGSRFEAFQTIKPPCVPRSLWDH